MTVINVVKIPIKTIDLSPGSHVLISNVTWEQYEALLEDLGEDRHIPRINYCNGTLELMSPLPAHERPHRIIADIVKAILDAQDRAWEDFGSTTFKRSQRAGLEPDTCFYIQNAEQVRSLLRMNMEQDPPPDLAIEADVTSKTTLEAYAVLQVPEVWIYDNGKLTINLLQNGEYQELTTSPTFPNMPITEMIPLLVKRAFEEGTSTMLRSLRRELAQKQ
jgi:Uma2 family endonuclease